MPNPLWRHALPLAAAFALLGANPAQAQSSGQIRHGQPSVPSAAAISAQSAPSPSGLRSPFPPSLVPGNAEPGRPTVRAPLPDSAGPQAGDAIEGDVDATVMGAAGAGGVRGPSQTVPQGSSGFSAVEIARSFLQADANGDGTLSRSEARRLRLATQSFEEMDRDFDGVLTRAEYEDGLR